MSNSFELKNYVCCFNHMLKLSAKTLLHPFNVGLGKTTEDCDNNSVEGLSDEDIDQDDEDIDQDDEDIDQDDEDIDQDDEDIDQDDEDIDQDDEDNEHSLPVS